MLRVRSTLNRAVFLVFAAILLISIVGMRAEAREQALLFGIVPQQSATRLAQIWIPFLERIAAETGLNIRFATTKDIPTFERCLAQGAYEFAYMNPYHYTVFSKSPGYRAFAKQKNKLLQGIIVVRKDNPVATLRDLAGKAISFPSPAAFGASVLPRAEMRRDGIEFEPVYVNSHDSVYRAVAAGLSPAGGGIKRTFNTIDRSIRDQLRIIYTTKGYTPHAFARGPLVSRQTAEKVAAAMIGIAKTAPELLVPLGMSAIAPAQDSDWDDVRGLHLSRKETEIVQEGHTVCRSD